MGTVVHLIKRLGSLVPADSEGEEALRAIAHGVEVKAEITIPVNAPFRRKFFALLGVVYPHVKETWPEREDFREQVLISLGFSRTVKRMDGTTETRAVSMKWHKMKEPEFRTLYESFVDLCVTKLLPGVGREDVTREFEEVLAGYQNSLASIETHLRGDAKRDAGGVRGLTGSPASQRASGASR